MGFLDRVVADMVTKSTGFNARGLVRMVGGKRMLALGGAALAGALVQDKMQGSTILSGGSSSGASSTPTTRKVPRSTNEMKARKPAELPPLPVTGGGSPSSPPPTPDGSVGPPPPPVPGSSAEEDVAELPPELLFPVLRTMVAAGLADGSMHEKEREAITSHLDESGLSDTQIARIHQDLLSPAKPYELAEMVDVDERELLLRFATLIALSDDEVTDRERTWLAKFSQALEIPAARVAVIERDIYG